MPFYIRKSVRAGPFRFNFSKGGVGLSVGVKGLRFGTGPRGHYVHAGRGGIYYRASLGGAGQKNASRGQIDHLAPPIPQQRREWTDAVDMVEIESGEVLEMRDANFADLLNEINAKQQQFRLSAMILGATACLFLIGLVSGMPQLTGTAVVLGLPGWLVGRWLDSYRRTTVIFYELEPDVESAYERLTQHSM